MLVERCAAEEPVIPASMKPARELRNSADRRL
jgi:hypothetical protein